MGGLLGELRIMLEAKEVRELHDKAFTHGQTTREKAADDLLFYWISQWDDTQLGGSTLQFRGQFDLLRKAGRQIITDIKSNPVQVDFEPVDDTDEGAGELIDGMYRADMRNNTALEAKENATTESIVCGYGAWELYHEYKTNRNGDSKQVIRRRPLYEANNQIFWDPNAKLADKSDADWVSCLVGYSEDGYKKLVMDLTGEEIDDVAESFAYPEHSYVFPWILGDSSYYVTRFYKREKIKVKASIYTDMLGSEKTVHEDDDEELGDDFTLVAEIEKEQYQISLYIVGGGDEVLEHSIIAGEHIPVIPVYGERAFVEGEEYYEGITRLAKDPQRLRNFQMSYLADISSRTPRTSPIYLAEQLQTFEHMYEENGPDDNFPYKLQNRFDAVGNELPLGPVGQTPDQPIPSALAASIQLSREAMDDVASVNLPKDIQDMDLSGEALVQLQKMFDKQSFTYQHNLKAALRRDGEIYASMASVVYDTERDVAVTRPDGTRMNETINQEEIDPETLQIKINNDVKGSIFDVYAEVGPSYNSVRDQDRKEMKEMIATEPPDSPMRQIMLLEYMTMKDGSAFKNMREYARNQLILQGIQEPETDEERQMLAQQQQQQQEQQQQDPAMTIAEAEMGKAQAEQMNAQANMQDKQIDQYNAETNRMELAIKAQEANAKARTAGISDMLKLEQTRGARIDNQLKVTGEGLRQASNR